MAEDKQTCEAYSYKTRASKREACLALISHFVMFIFICKPENKAFYVHYRYTFPCTLCFQNIRCKRLKHANRARSRYIGIIKKTVSQYAASRFLYIPQALPASFFMYFALYTACSILTEDVFLPIEIFGEKYGLPFPCLHSCLIENSRRRCQSYLGRLRAWEQPIFFLFWVNLQPTIHRRNSCCCCRSMRLEFSLSPASFSSFARSFNIITTFIHVLPLFSHKLRIRNWQSSQCRILESKRRRQLLFRIWLFTQLPIMFFQCCSAGLSSWLAHLEGLKC